jgi:hypothetical protein
MAKFNLKELGAGLSFGGTALTCLQSVELTGTAPSTEVECSGSTTVEYVTGLPRYSMTATGALETDDEPLIEAVQPNDNGAIAFDPAGTATGTIDISSTSATVTDFSMSTPVNGFASYSVSWVLDDITYDTN